MGVHWEVSATDWVPAHVTALVRYVFSLRKQHKSEIPTPEVLSGSVPDSFFTALLLLVSLEICRSSSLDA